MQVLGLFSKFEQCVLNISLINICNQESYVGQQMRQTYNQWKGETAETVYSPWLDIHQFTIYLPHPEQEYEDITLAAGLTQGYNVEVQPVANPIQLPYRIPRGGHFVVVLRQKKLDGDFKIAGTGIFIRPLGILSLDLIVDPDLGEYQSIIIKHPIIRDYPQDWESKLNLFLKGEINSEDLPPIVKYVDQAFNRDYRQPSWNDIYLTATGFSNITP